MSALPAQGVADECEHLLRDLFSRAGVATLAQVGGALPLGLAAAHDREKGLPQFLHRTLPDSGWEMGGLKAMWFLSRLRSMSAGPFQVPGDNPGVRALGIIPRQLALVAHLFLGDVSA